MSQHDDDYEIGVRTTIKPERSEGLPDTSCPACDGRGQVDVMSPADNMEHYQQTCWECDGTGRAEVARMQPHMQHVPHHTCIHDDGGTPGRRCYGCEEEKTMEQQIRARLAEKQEQAAKDFDWNALRAIVRAIHQNNVAKGFTASMDNIDRQLMLQVRELSEAHEEYRDGRAVDEVYYKDGKPEGFPIELADAVIRILGFAHHHRIDIAEAIRIKMTYNAGRPFMHGRQF